MEDDFVLLNTADERDAQISRVVQALSNDLLSNMRSKEILCHGGCVDHYDVKMGKQFGTSSFPFVRLRPHIVSITAALTVHPWQIMSCK